MTTRRGEKPKIFIYEYIAKNLLKSSFYTQTNKEDVRCMAKSSGNIYKLVKIMISGEKIAARRGLTFY